MEYRKRIEIDRDKDYVFVEMGELNRLNGPASYPFPTEEAARLFATNHKRIAKQQHGVDRDIRLRFPDGTIEEITHDA